ncbi:unnamed protein product [Arctogadus glacialis]
MAKGDPRKPKGKMSAYAYFIKTCRQEHEKKTPEVPVNFTMFSKKCSERWKTITSKEKGKFEDMAKLDKVRYDNEMQHFAPGRKKGQKKDPNAPKRPSSGFFIFCADHRPKIKAVHPTLGIGDVAKKLGEQWNNLTDANKQPYLQKANKLKDKYQKDVADYKSKGKVGGGASLVQQQQTQQQQHTTTNNDDDEDEDEDDDEDDDDDE